MPKLPRPPRWASMNFLRGAQPGLESLALASVLPSLGSSVAPVALPTLAMSFQVSFGTVQWVLLAYLLALTLALLVVGGVSDRVGRGPAGDLGPWRRLHGGGPARRVRRLHRARARRARLHVRIPAYRHLYPQL